MPSIDPGNTRFVVSAIVRNPPICVECLIRETGVTRARVTAILTSGDAALKVVSYSGSCSGCRETKRVFRPRDSN